MKKHINLDIDDTISHDKQVEEFKNKPHPMSLKKELFFRSLVVVLVYLIMGYGLSLVSNFQVRWEFALGLALGNAGLHYVRIKRQNRGKHEN